MTFSTIDPTQIEVGKATRKELFQKIKDNEDDHDERLNALEVSAQKIPVFNGPVVGLGQLGSASSVGIVNIYPVLQDISIVQAQLTVIRAGDSGATVMDILTGPDIDNLVSIFSAKPSADFSDGNNYKTVNQVISLADIDEGQILALAFDTVQNAMGPILVNVLAEPR